jgi:hypothetical protein
MVIEEEHVAVLRRPAMTRQFFEPLRGLAQAGRTKLRHHVEFGSRPVAGLLD